MKRGIDKLWEEIHTLGMISSEKRQPPNLLSKDKARRENTRAVDSRTRRLERTSKETSPTKSMVDEEIKHCVKRSCS